MYEHSYYIDYQNKKADYADKFTDHVNWAEIERRLRACRG
jgi:Fe-Mn family superoxide dismutase